jgi:hypothetical protein
MRDGKITTPAIWVDGEPQWYSGEFNVRSVAYAKYWAMSTLQHTPHWAHLNDVATITPQFAQILAKSGVYIFQVLQDRFYWIFDKNDYPTWYVGLDGSRAMIYPSSYDEMINFGDGQLEKLIPFTEKISEINKMMLTAIHDMGTDAPRSERLLKYIKEWNENYAEKYNCKVSMATAEEYALYLKKVVVEKNITLSELTGVNFPWPWAGPFSGTLMQDHTRVENLLPTVEMFAVAAEQLGLAKYPHEKINSAWEAILWTPDHNWGSIGKEKKASAAKGRKITDSLLQSTLSSLAGAVKRDSSQGNLVVVFNPLNWKQSEMVEVTVPLESGSKVRVVDSQGKRVPVQILSSTRGKDLSYQVKLLIQADNVPGLGYKSYWVKNNPGLSGSTTTLTSGKNFIENKYYKITVNKQDRAVSIYDKTNRMELFKTSGEKRFGRLDAWNLRQAKVRVKMTITDVKVSQRGPLRATLRVTGTFKKKKPSTIIQDFSLDHGRDQVLQSIYLGESLPPGTHYNFLHQNENISDSLRLGVPYGSIPFYPYSAEQITVNYSSRSPKIGFSLLEGTRFTNKDYVGRSFDIQKWASIGDSTYTVDVAFDNLQTRSFIKDGHISTMFRGSEDYRGPWNFSFRGHRGDWREANTPRFGWEVSHPMIGVVSPPEKAGKGVLPAQMGFWDVSSTGDNVVISALKRGFDKTGVVLRFCEFLDRDTTVSVRPNPMLHIPTAEVALTDMVETPLQLASKSRNSYQIPILGFGVETMKFFSRQTTDRIPPSPITDLKVMRSTSRTTELAWSASGDDKMEGNATGYDMRYSNRPINSLNWDRAIRLKNPPSPVAPGQIQQFRLDELTPDKTYFLSVRSLDEAGNTSNLSNIVYFKTESRDRTPPARIKNLSVSESGSTWVTLRWSATGDDGIRGIADHYDLRFFTAPLDKTIWKKKATQLIMDVIPEKTGSDQSFTVTGLKPATKYYFAIAAVDEEGNSSSISNHVFRKTNSLKKVVYQNGVSPSSSYKGCSDTTISSVSEDVENVNFGEAKFLRTWLGGVRLILIRFRKSGLSPDAKISHARLKLYCYDITYQDRGTATCYSIKRDWDEHDATWHHAIKSRKWPSPGKGVIEITTDYGFGPNGIIDHAKVADGGGWVEFDVTKALRNQMQKNDFGFAIKGNCPNDCGIYYYSSEFEDDPTKRPVLEISY